MEWQPIETAPKDGSILVFEDLYGERIDVARWDRGEWTSVFGVMDEGVMVRWRISGIAPNNQGNSAAESRPTETKAE